MKGGHDGHPRGESHTLNSARVPSRPGNNGGTFDSKGGHGVDSYRLLYDARTPGQLGNIHGGSTFDTHGHGSYPTQSQKHMSEAKWIPVPMTRLDYPLNAHVSLGRQGNGNNGTRVS